MPSNSRLRFYKLAKFVHKIGILIGILAFTFDGKRSIVKRSRVLELYNYFSTFWAIAIMIAIYVEACDILAKDTHIDDNAQMILIVLNIIQALTYTVFLMSLLIFLVSNRQAIVDLINDGLKIEQEFRRSYKVNAWRPATILLIINAKDIINSIGLTYFSITLNAKNAPISNIVSIPYSMVSRFFFSFTENLKFLSLFYLAHLLRTLNVRLQILKRIEPQSDYEVLQAFEKVSKMYGKLLMFAERMCKLLKYHTTCIFAYSLIVTSAKV